MKNNRPVTGLLLIAIIFLLMPVQSYSSNPTNINSNDYNITPILSYEIVNVFPHDLNAFTQGLIWKEGYLYESTGLYGSSSLRKTDLTTGEVLQHISLPNDYFAEGITIFNGKIFLLTWKEKTGFIFDINTFNLIDTFHYTYEGWGITNDDEHLIVSDGTSALHIIDPEKLEEVKQINVHDGIYLINNINELEYIDGYIFANIWQTEKIAVIEPDSGKVVFWLDLSGILDNVGHNKKVDVLNGIAYDVENNRLFVTGKFWPVLFEIEMASESGSSVMTD